MNKAGINISAEDLDQIIKSIDTQKNGQINYSEFLAATVNINKLMTNDNLKSIFQNFDTDGSGKITKEDIVVAFSKKGKKVSEE